MKKVIHLPRDLLYNLYVTKGLTAREVALKLNVSKATVLRRLESYGIPRRERRVRIPREILEKLYWVEHLTQKEISERLGISRRLVIKLMKEYNIEKRKMGSHRLIKPHLELSPELAYIIGVLLGDGSIRKNRIELTVKPKQFAQEFARALQKIGLHPLLWKDKRRYHRVVALSKIFTEWFREGKWTPIVEKHPLPFLRGFFQSEGTIAKCRRGYIHNISFINTNLNLLLFVGKFIECFGFRTEIHLKRPETERSKAVYYLDVHSLKYGDKRRFLELIDCEKGKFVKGYQF